VNLRLIETTDGAGWLKKVLSRDGGLNHKQAARATMPDGTVFWIGQTNELGGVCDDCTVPELKPKAAVKIEIFEEA
jgi:hypothetical protein